MGEEDYKKWAKVTTDELNTYIGFKILIVIIYIYHLCTIIG